MQTFKKTTVAAAIVLSMSAFAAQADETATSTPTNPTLAEFQKGFSGQTFTDGAFTIANSAAVDPVLNTSTTLVPLHRTTVAFTVVFFILTVKTTNSC